jgi:nitroreductase/NAD-dependent dihydropyrimidine dehydrogenase PreA subunit
MSIITVNKNECTQCNACVESCPVSLFENNTLGEIFPSINEANESRCIYCGHCESVCPSNALVHKLSDQALKSNDSVIRNISSEELGSYFKSRRSIRQFKPKPVAQQTLEQVLDVVRYAPTGTNRQMNQWVIISDSIIIKKLSELTINWMRIVCRANVEMANRIGMPRIISAHEKGMDIICRNAPCIAITYTLSSYPGGVKDAVIAASHLELLLPSFGLGGCWAGYLMIALQNSTEMKKLIGLDDNFTIHASLMIGYPKYQYAKVPARNSVNVKWL